MCVCVCVSNRSWKTQSAKQPGWFCLKYARSTNIRLVQGLPFNFVGFLEQYTGCLGLPLAPFCLQSIWALSLFENTPPFGHPLFGCFYRSFESQPPFFGGAGPPRKRTHPFFHLGVVVWGKRKPSMRPTNWLTYGRRAFARSSCGTTFKATPLSWWK